MKPYTASVEIDLPRARVIELFDNPDNLPKWQPGLESFEPISGEPGQVGAKSRMVFVYGKKRIEMTETITERNLPEVFSGLYDWPPGGSNTLENRFVELGPDRTRWESTCAYTLHKLPLKLMGTLAPGMFKRQNQKFMENFKAFCETGADVRET